MLPGSVPGKADIAQRYPKGVPYSQSGRADFSEHAVADLKFGKGELTGHTGPDVSAARQRLMAEQSLTMEEVKQMEVGRTWHHAEGGQQMQLVPRDLHDAYKHTGGRADIKAGNWFEKGAAAVMGFLAPRYAKEKETGGDKDLGLMQDAVTYAPVIGDAIGIMAEGLEATDRTLQRAIERPHDLGTHGNIRARLLKGEDLDSVLDNQ